MSNIGDFVSPISDGSTRWTPGSKASDNRSKELSKKKKKFFMFGDFLLKRLINSPNRILLIRNFLKDKLGAET
jgi:hypothetical protein